jgi:ATP-dependent DNA helicase RecG
MKRFRLFISSVQKELQSERYAIRDYVHGDPLLRRYFDVFLFENLPASDRRADNVYLEEVDRCDVYVGLFGSEYGNENDEGLSPTEREFDRATSKGKLRLVFVKGTDDKARQPKMLKLVRKAGAQLIRRRFNDIPDLNSALYASLVEHLERSGELRTLPFDASACPRATMKDLPQEKIRSFLEIAKRERIIHYRPRVPEKRPLSTSIYLTMDTRHTQPSYCSAGNRNAFFRHPKSNASTSTALKFENPSRLTRFSRARYLIL